MHGREFAPAKVNLTLHVGRVIRDSDRFHGYHPLDSLVVFANPDRADADDSGVDGALAGDRLDIGPAERFRLDITGPFAADLDPDEDNLVTRAYRAAQRLGASGPVRITLDKHLPVASGLGGGSADAAAVLRALAGGAPDLDEAALQLGADVPACLRSATLRMTGIGEDIRELPGLGRIWAVLANPGTPVSTAEIFRRFDAFEPRETPRPQAAYGALLERALDGRNDLEPVAVAIEPAIGQLIERMAVRPGCELARMSGSGASVFGLFADEGTARDAATSLAQVVPWAVACRLGDG